MSGDEDALGEPLHLLCPITHIMYQDPVRICNLGNCYERWAILEHWRRKGWPHDPMTNMDLARTTRLRTDWERRAEVQHYLDMRPGYTPDGWKDRRVPEPQEEPWLHVFLRSLPRFTDKRGPVMCLVLMQCLLMSLFNAAAQSPEDPGRLLKLLRTSPHSPSIQRNACGALAEISFGNAKGAAFVAERGGVDVVMDAMQNHTGHVELQTACAAALANVAHESAERSQLIIDMGGVERMLDIFKRHSGDRKAMRNACTVLDKLAIASEEGRNVIVQAGGVLSVLKMLRGNSEDIMLQRTACAVLEALAIGGRENENKQVIEEAGSIEEIVATLQRRNKNPTLQGHCASALSNLLPIGSGLRQRQARLVQAGGFDRLLDILKLHPEHPWAQGHALSALHALVDKNMEHQRAFLASDGISTIATALRTNRGNLFVRRHSCRLLVCLAAGHEEVTSEASTILEEMTVADVCDGVDELW